MKLIKGLSALGCLTIATMAYDYSDNVPADTLPPGGLSIEQAPLFVTIGFDDNTRKEGLEWAVNFFKDKKNADGSDARVSFFVNSMALAVWEQEDPDTLAAGINLLKNSGHEIANHTYDHWGAVNAAVKYDWDLLMDSVSNAGVSDWYGQMSDCNDTLFKYTDFTIDDIHGFRTPFLAYSDSVFGAIRQMGIKYDCTIEEGGAAQFDGTNFRWPYTMDNGIPVIMRHGRIIQIIQTIFQ